MTFDPNATGNNDNGVFSLPFSQEESQLVLLSVPWEVTTSYGDGCSLGPDTILESSKQLDLCDSLYGTFYEKGIFQIPSNPNHIESGKVLKQKATQIRETLESGKPLSNEEKKDQDLINSASQKTNSWVYEQCQEILKKNKFCGVIGGDHSSPFGLIKALKEQYSDISILQIDAHMDLRKSYQGYKYSHASIMRNVMEELKPHSLVQMGIRDFCPEEHDYGQSKDNIHTFFDSQVGLHLSQGKTWSQISQEAISFLSDSVYISFDIDGLMPDLCPNTGTPVPGGISFQQMETLLYNLSQSGKKIIGFDLCEVSPGAHSSDLNGWDGNVGSRVLFKLCGSLLHQK